jgi:hypothetical protein
MDCEKLGCLHGGPFLFTIMGFDNSNVMKFFEAIKTFNYPKNTLPTAFTKLIAR